MTAENKKVLISRTKSFIWRLAGVCIVASLNFLADQIGMFDLPVYIVGILGLVVGETTKYFNVNLPELRERKINSDINR